MHAAGVSEISPAGSPTLVAARPRKSSKSVVFLPDSAFKNARTTPSPLVAPVGSPAAQTPHDAPKTTWRTVVCPYAPERRPCPLGADSSFPEASPTSMGIRTPANFWPTPNSMLSTSFCQPSPLALAAAAPPYTAISPFAGMSPVAAMQSCTSAASGVSLPGLPQAAWLSPMDSRSPGATSLDKAMMLDSPMRSSSSGSSLGSSASSPEKEEESSGAEMAGKGLCPSEGKPRSWLPAELLRQAGA